ncbi:MAG: amidohydrolase family protein [Leucobacter sp.]
MKLYTAHRLFTQGEAGDITDGAAVLVNDDKFEWVGREADFPSSDYPADLERVDMGDVTLLPGLIDAHVHLGFDGGPEPVNRMNAESDPEQTVLMMRSARELLSVGVTTARDLGARSYLDVVVRDSILNGVVQGPRLITAGSPITPTGGHCWFMGGEADGTDEVLKTVRKHHRAGVDAIKVMSTGGFMTAGSAPWFAQYETEALRTIVEESHRLGKIVAAHGHGVQGIERAVEAGVDTIEHCSFVHDDGSMGIVPELADRIAASKSAVSPTCNFRAVDMAKSIEGYQPAFIDLWKRGATIIASTDSGIDNTPHHAFIGALEAMHYFGMDNDTILTSATSLSATVLGVDDKVGSVTVGLDADLLAVKGNPRENLSDLRNLELVLSRGEKFTPDALSPIPEFNMENTRFGQKRETSSR